MKVLRQRFASISSVPSAPLPDYPGSSTGQDFIPMKFYPTAYRGDIGSSFTLPYLKTIP